MGDENRPPSLDDLGRRLRAAREHRGTGGRSADTPEMSGIGFAFRIGVEMVSALAVGVGIGLLIDWWLDTRPWFLVVFLLLGAGAAMLNVYRTTRGYGLAVGYRREGDAGANGIEGDVDSDGKAGRHRNGAEADRRATGNKDE